MPDNLSPREEEILRLAATGLTDKQIGAELGLQLSTIRTYWDRVKQKLDAGNRTEAVARSLTILSPRGDGCDLESFKKFSEQLPYLIVLAAEMGGMEYANKAWFDYFGLDHFPKTWEKLVHPDDLITAREIYARSLADRVPVQWHVRFRRFDGVYRRHLATACMVQFQGCGLKRVGNAIDIEQ